MGNIVRWTPQQLADHTAKSKTKTPTERMQALGRLPAGVMNKTESAYAMQLTVDKHVGSILWFEFESMKFRLADKTFYTPDFAVMTADGNMQLHEVKGRWTDDARVKIKVAAAKFPFQFIAIKKCGASWDREFF
jgi:hypothetical protein